jgi:hypothetical protein
MMWKETEHNTKKQLSEIPKTEYERYFWHWQEWWKKCVHAEGAYFGREQACTPVYTVPWFSQIQF